MLKKFFMWIKSLFTKKENAVETIDDRSTFEKLAATIGYSKVVIGDMLRIIPGGRHAWFESSVGSIRKPI